MNEVYFFIHILLVLSGLFIALRLGKEVLISCFVLQAILANLFVIKQIELFGFTVTSTDVFTIGALFSLSLLQEFYDGKVVRRAIVSTFFCMIFFVVLGKIHLLYQASTHDFTQGAFQTILGSSPRIIIASLSVTLLAQKVHVEFFDYLVKKFPSQTLFTRSTISIVASQVFDTFAFSFVGLYGIVHNIWHIILVSLVIKMIIVFCMTPFAQLSRKMMRTA